MNWDVTIGIPVYNGEDRLEITLASLVKNHGGVKEIIISDNASTDRTPKIAKYYAGKYKNIHHIRQTKKIPVGDNWAATLQNATGKYFMFMGHHDLISENYFSELVPLLEEDPQAVIAIPSIRPFIQNPGDIPDKKAAERGLRYFNPLKSKIISPDIRERIYAVLRDQFTCYMSNQLFRTDIIKKIWPEVNNPHCINSDHVVAMYAALLGHCKASNKAFFYYESSKIYQETGDDITKRYSENTMTNVPIINSKNYIPKLYWQLCQKYAPHIADDLLLMDIKISSYLNFRSYFNEQEWMEAYVALSPPNVDAKGLSRAYCAISTALREEENCRFYRKHYKGQFSEFRPIAEQRAEEFYLRMWEVLLRENYFVPKYNLNAEETEMFNKLLRYKNERLQFEKNNEI